MIRHINYVYRRINIIGDGAISGISFLIAVAFRSYASTGSFFSLGYYQRHLWGFYVCVVLWPLLLNLNGLYPTNRTRTIKRAVGIIIKSSIQGLLILLALLFALKMQAVSRLIVFGFSVLVTILLILKESLIILELYYLRKKGKNIKNVLIAGTFDSVKDLVEKVEGHSFLGMRVVAFLIPQDQVKPKKYDSTKIMGTLSDIEEVLRAHPIDIAMISLDRRDYKEVDTIMYRCMEEGVEVWLTASLFSIKAASLDVDNILGVPLFIFRMGPQFSLQLFIKEMMDYIGALVLAIISFPVVLISALLIKITSPGPILYRHQRCGLHGRIFTLYKLRTMYHDADKCREALKEENIMKGPAFKMDKDPRITAVGRFLRKFSIDELPQFWNVLKTDMSLIGPRPPVPEEVSEYTGWQRRRLSMRPGITGLWQVSGRSHVTDFNKLAALDLKYIDTWSLKLDFKIFLKTIWVVFSTRGAK